jgi:hypothetical protein
MITARAHEGDLYLLGGQESNETMELLDFVVRPHLALTAYNCP